MSIKLELRHLSAIHAIAKTGNGTQAARILNISQSALSHRLHEAERRLDTKIYTQVGKALKLTPAGERLNEAAIQCLGELASAEREVDLKKLGVEHVIKLGVSLYAPFHWLPDLIARLSAEHSNIEIEIVTGVSPAVIEMLHYRKIDLAIVTGEVKSQRFKSTPLYQDELLVFLKRSHPKARKPYFSADDFRDEIFVSETSQREWVGTHKSFFERLGTNPKHIMQVGHGEGVMALIKSGIAITADTRHKLAVFRKDRSIVTLPITESGLRTEYYLVAERNVVSSSPQGVVIRTLKEVAKGGASQKSR